MGELATAPADQERYAKDGFQITTPAMVDRISAVIADLEKDESLYPKDWVIPGGTRVFLRLSISLAQRVAAPSGILLRSISDVKFNVEILRYLNRLSDLCWVLARYVEKDSRKSS